ncbi:MAG: sugar phosphate isomerase/epimerase [Clostridia bacterium]|nr:sugar phosphate isomerase/epimerase [Clostridia bacterium]
MKFAADINCFYGVYSIEETIDIYAAAGFETINFEFMDKCTYNGEMSVSKRKNYFTSLKKYAQDRGVSFPVTHAPFPAGSKDEAENEQFFQNIVRGIENSSYLGAEIIVVHGMDHIRYESENGPEQLYEMNMEFYNRLEHYAEEYGLQIGIENLPQIQDFSDVHSFFGCYRAVGSICSTPEEMLRYLNDLNSDSFVGCLDIGHAMITGQNPERFIRMIGGEKLKALHIHDNNGVRDMHTLPYFGGMADWDKIMEALAEIQFDGVAAYETGNFLKMLPKELYPAGVDMMAAVAKNLSGKFEKYLQIK